MYSLDEARELVIKAGLELNKLGLIVRTWGNISARISDTQFVITPSGRSYDSLTMEDIVIMNIKDCSYEGNVVPSSECGTHAEVYKLRPNVNFVIHAHSLYASAMSTCALDITDIASYNDVATNEHKDYESILGPSIPCAGYGANASSKLIHNIHACLKKNPASHSLLMQKHGILCMGTDYDNAFDIAQSMEEVCKSRYDYITGSYVSTDLNIGEYYGNSVRDNNFITLTLGDSTACWTCSQLSDASFKDVPHNLKNVCALHDLIYRNYPLCRAINHTTTQYTTIMSLRKKGFRPYIDDQAQLIGADVQNVNPRIRFHAVRNASKILRALNNHNAVLLASGGALCIGNTMDDADAASIVLEKGCLAANLNTVLHTNKPLPKRAAQKYHDDYINHYSHLKDYAVTATDIAATEEALSASDTPASLFPPTTPQK